MDGEERYTYLVLLATCIDQQSMPAQTRTDDHAIGERKQILFGCKWF